MKTIFKILLFFIILLIFLIGGSIFLLSNSKRVDFLARNILKQVDNNITYKSLSGNFFDTLSIKGFNYQNSVKADLKLKLDFFRIRDHIIKIDDINISNLYIDENFLNSILKNSKKEKKTDDKISSIKSIIVKNAFLNLIDFRYKEYFVKEANLTLKNLKSNLKDKISANIKSSGITNIADFRLKGDIKENNYHINSLIKPKKSYLTKLLNDKKLKIKSGGYITVLVDGNLRKLKSKIDLTSLALSNSDIKIEDENLTLISNYTIKNKELFGNLHGNILSNIAYIKITEGGYKLNLNDINNSTKYNLKSQIFPKNRFIKTVLKEQNLSIKKGSKILLSLKGGLKKSKILISLKNSVIKYNNLDINPKNLTINGNYNIKEGDLKANIDTNISSDIANFDLLGDIFLNSLDINKTLKINLISNLTPQNRKIDSLFVDKNLTIKKMPKCKIKISGNFKNIDYFINLDKAKIVYDKTVIDTKKFNLKGNYSLKSGKLNSFLNTDIKSSFATLLLDTNMNLNTKDINNTLSLNSHMYVKDAKEHLGINLAPLGNIKVDIKGNLHKLNSKIVSKKLKLIVNSSNLDRLQIQLNTKKIYIDKIYKKLPKEFKNSFIDIKSEGFYTLSTKEANFKTKIRGLRYANKIIYTPTFNLHIKRDNISLENFALLSDKFNMKLKLKKVGDKIDAKIDNKQIKGFAKISLKPLFVDAKISVYSIKKLIKEIQKVYPLDVGINIDGPLQLIAKSDKKDAKITINSKAIKLEDGYLKNLNIKALYNPHRILIKNFDLKLSGYKPKKINRAIKLKKDGLITLDRNNNVIDIEFDNLLKFKGSQKKDVATGKLTTKDLFLAYKGYGSTRLTTDLTMYQTQKKLAVTGNIEFEDSEINYESPFLDVSKDPDIIIISKANKKKNSSNSFLNDTFLDISVKSKNEMLYKVEAGEVEFQPDIKIRKDFGSQPKITGKIKVLDGWYDLADKRFLIKEGAIAFRGQKGSNPLLDLHVNYAIDDVLIQIYIGGDKNRPKLTFKSKPMMSKKDIFSYLLFGFKASETEGAASSANKAAEKIFGRALAKDLARELHLDRLDMNRNSLGGVDIKAGKKINKKSILYYQNKDSESSILYERKLNKNWSVQTEVGKKGQGIDLFFRKGYK